MTLDLLTVITFLPLLGAVVVFVLPRSQVRLARIAALGFSLAVLALSIYAFYQYASGGCPASPQPTPGGSPFVFACENAKTDFFPLLKSSWHVGIDGLSAAMVLLTGLLTPLAILISFEVTDRVHEHMALFLFLETGLMGVFVSLDLLFFFLFWEIGLVPGISDQHLGGGGPAHASFKFFRDGRFARPVAVDPVDQLDQRHDGHPGAAGELAEGPGCCR
jgi:NADH-quinone oxidoreductase subunit M